MTGRCIEGCGACCVPVLLAYSQEDVRYMVPYKHEPVLVADTPGGDAHWRTPYDPEDALHGDTHRIDRRTRRWILKELTPISWDEARRLRPDLAVLGARTRREDGSYADSHAYLCKWFDYDTRRCTNYEDRPDTCRDWPPADGGVPPPGMRPGLPPTCGFWPMFGRRPEPLPDRWEPVTLTRKDR